MAPWSHDPNCLSPSVPTLPTCAIRTKHVSVLQLYYPLCRVSYERIMLSYPSELDSLIGPVLLSDPWNLVKSPQSRGSSVSLSLHQPQRLRSRLSEPQALTYWLVIWHIPVDTIRLNAMAPAEKIERALLSRARALKLNETTKTLARLGTCSRVLYDQCHSHEKKWLRCKGEEGWSGGGKEKIHFDWLAPHGTTL